jgi:hypothetical protein
MATESGGCAAAMKTKTVLDHSWPDPLEQSRQDCPGRLESHLRLHRSTLVVAHEVECHVRKYRLPGDRLSAFNLLVEKSDLVRVRSTG